MVITLRAILDHVQGTFAAIPEKEVMSGRIKEVAMTGKGDRFLKKKTHCFTIENQKM